MLTAYIESFLPSSAHVVSNDLEVFKIVVTKKRYFTKTLSIVPVEIYLFLLHNFVLLFCMGLFWTYSHLRNHGQGS